MTPTEVLFSIEAEKQKASDQYGPFTSSHEGYGVLAEEMSELLSAIHANAREQVRIEAMQVAAVAWRLAECCDDEAFQERSGFNRRGLDR